MIGPDSSSFTQANDAVQGGPGHDLSVDMLKLSRAQFPDSMIGFDPCPADQIPDLSHQLLCVTVEFFGVFNMMVQRQHQLAVDIELMLPIGLVADPYW